MQKNNNDIYSNELRVLYKLYKSQLPNSIILTGQDVDIITNIANNFASLVISEKLIQDYNEFQESIYNSHNQETQFLLKNACFGGFLLKNSCSYEYNKKGVLYE